jgi:cysteinyl-tRNA synthetase
MSWAHLGETFDIHGGGIDLVFPHHENEIAQSCCAFDRAVMANYWMHNGFLQVEGEKMSKSLGNFVTIHELLHTEKFGGRKWPGEVLRLAMLRTHYRQPIDWTVKALEEADRTISDWAELYTPSNEIGRPSEKFIAALSDDLNSSEAISELHRLRKAGDGSALKGSLQLLGLGRRRVFSETVSETLHATDSVTAQMLESNDEVDRRTYINRQVSARLAARASKNWAESDRIRDELAAMGIALKDNKDGTTSWEVKR